MNTSKDKLPNIRRIHDTETNRYNVKAEIVHEPFFKLFLRHPIILKLHVMVTSLANLNAIISLKVYLG